MIITKEAKDVAVKMWESIRDEWLKDPKGTALAMYKAIYLQGTPFSGQWDGNCLLCAYHNNDCDRCPLKNCGSHYAEYRTVCTVDRPMKDRIAACNEIIKHLKQIPLMYRVKMHGKLWVWLHCRRTRGGLTQSSCYVDKKSTATLFMPNMFNDLVGKTLEVSVPDDTTASKYIGSANGYWVPKWLVKKVINK